MAVVKQSMPSFASIVSILSIVFYCAGFLRVELELQEQKERINALESVAETKSQPNDADMKIIKNAREIQSSKLNRHSRQVDSTKNSTEAQRKAETILEINKLLSEGSVHLCQSKGVTCPSGPTGPPGPPGPRGHKGDRGRRGQKGRTGNKGDQGIMGSPGKSGKQGIMGPVGLQGETGNKGEKGDIGLSGMPGTKGEPGESISSPAVVVYPVTLTVNEGGTASFQCSASGNPEPAVTWGKLNSKSEITQSAVSGGKLELKKVTGSDSGVYQCSATNILGNSQEVVRLAVNVHPQVSLQPGPKFATVGSDVSLPTCQVIGYPAPVVTWRKSIGQLPQGRAHYNNSVLQISNVHKTDSDWYFCSAVNLLGNVEKKTQLVVVSLPVFTVQPLGKVFAATGKTLTLNCSATGDPQPVISWKRQGAALPVRRSHKTHNGGLIIRDLREEDAGNYICVATSAGVFDVEAISDVEVRKPRGADTKYCHFCAEQNEATCLAKQQNQTCATDRNSLGTAHCTSAVVRYRNQFGNTMEGFFRGCVDCSKNKKELYAEVGDFYKARRGWFLMQGDIICCTGDNCNTEVPSLQPADAQYRHCNYCLKPNAATCLASQRNQICVTDPESFGTSHCASAVLQYEDGDGRVQSGFMRGCINCASKRTACAVIRADVKRFYNWDLKQCEIECCTDNNCNNHIPIFISQSKALAISAASPDGHNVLISTVLVFGAAFVNILYYIK